MITCRRCGKNKPPSAFYKHPIAANGVMSPCKLCRSDARNKPGPQRDYRIDNQRVRSLEYSRNNRERLNREQNERRRAMKEKSISINDIIILSTPIPPPQPSHSESE